jgi:hypothetical protein
VHPASPGPGGRSAGVAGGGGRRDSGRGPGAGGRPKTDQKDAQWIARLAEMGLLRPSFVPPPEIRALRDLTRARLQLVGDRTREWQRLAHRGPSDGASPHG